jgi:hypothetical protein
MLFYARLISKARTGSTIMSSCFLFGFQLRAGMIQATGRFNQDPQGKQPFTGWEDL